MNDSDLVELMLDLAEVALDQRDEAFNALAVWRSRALSAEAALGETTEKLSRILDAAPCASVSYTYPFFPCGWRREAHGACHSHAYETPQWLERALESKTESKSEKQVAPVP